MAHIYLTFDFAKDEEKAQQARHKLEGWKQAFRLDKKLLYKVERIAAATPADGDQMAVLCDIVVRKNRITTVTISLLERPPRCQCRNTAVTDQQALRSCIG